MLRNFKDIYNYVGLTEQQFNDLYNEAIKSEKPKEVFHKLILDYLRKNADIDIVKRYLHKIVQINLEVDVKIIEKKLNTFYKFLDSIYYILTPSDAKELIKEPFFKVLFDKKFLNKNKITQGTLEGFIADNDNLEVLCNEYLNENKIKVVDGQSEAGKMILSKSLLSREEEIELAKKIQTGDINARNKMIEKNQGLVRHIALKFQNRGLEYDDLVQEGNIGLMRAIELFDYNKGYSFSTFAIWWIRQAVYRALENKSSTIRVPTYLYRKVVQIDYAINELNKSLNRTPTLEEIAAEVVMSVEELKKILENKQSIISIYTKIGDDEDSELIYYLKDHNANVENEAIENNSYEFLLALIKEILSEKEFNIICKRLGLIDGKEYTLEEISKDYNVTRERIRQIETRALNKLKGNRNIQKLDNDEVFVPIKITQKKKEESVEISSVSVFDIKEINSEITNEEFYNLLNLLPKKDIEYYTKYRNINIKNKIIYPKKEQDYPKNFIIYMSVIERDLNDMYLYYKKLTKERYINREEALGKVKNRMIHHSIRFRYPKYSQAELVKYVSKLPEKLKETIYLRYGKNLIDYNKFPIDKLHSYDQRLYLALKKLEQIIHNDTLGVDNKSLLAKFPDLTFEELNGYIQKMSLKLQNVIYIRYGEKLDKYNSFPNDKSYQCYYQLHKRAIDKLSTIINGTDKNKERAKSIINTYTLKDLLYALPKLSESDRNVIYLRHGNELNSVLDWPKAPVDKHNNYYIQKYYNCFKKIDKILKQKEINRNNTYLIKKLGDYTYEEIISAVSQLNKDDQDIIYLKHGKTLDEFNPYPVYNKIDNYKKLYDEAIYNLKKILKFIKYPEEYEKTQKIIEENKKDKVKNYKKRKSIINKISHDDLLWSIQYLTENQKNILILRHGSNFEEFLPWPKVPQGKSNNYYNVNYFYACKKVTELIEHKEEIESPKTVIKKNRHRKSHLTLIEKYGREELLKFMELLTENQKNILYVRHGENLDQIIPWPEVPEGKSINYYCSGYGYIEKKIDKIVNGKTKEKIKKTQNKKHKKTIIDEIEHTKLVELVEQLSGIQKEIIYLRHGVNLDQVLPWPEVSESKNLNYYNNTYYYAIKRINTLLSMNTSKTSETIILNGKDASDNKIINRGSNLCSIIEKFGVILKKYENDSSLEINLEEFKDIYNSMLRVINDESYQKEKKTDENIQYTKKNAKKTEKLDKISENQQVLIDKKTELEKLKLNNFVTSLYREYSQKYGEFLIEEKLYNIIKNAISSYSYEEGISIDISVKFKIESAIIIELSNLYKKNPDSNESLEILLLLEEIYGKKLKERYGSISEEIISKAIEETFTEYTGRLPFYSDVAVRIKKLFR